MAFVHVIGNGDLINLDHVVSLTKSKGTQEYILRSAEDILGECGRVNLEETFIQIIPNNDFEIVEPVHNENTGLIELGVVHIIAWGLNVFGDILPIASDTKSKPWMANYAIRKKGSPIIIGDSESWDNSDIWLKEIAKKEVDRE